MKEYTLKGTRARDSTLKNETYPKVGNEMVKIWEDPGMLEGKGGNPVLMQKTTPSRKSILKLGGPHVGRESKKPKRTISGRPITPMISYLVNSIPYGSHATLPITFTHEAPLVYITHIATLWW